MTAFAVQVAVARTLEQEASNALALGNLKGGVRAQLLETVGRLHEQCAWLLLQSSAVHYAALASAPGPTRLTYSSPPTSAHAAPD